MKKKQLKIPKNALYFNDDANISLSEPDDSGKQYFAIEAYSGKIIKNHSYWGDLAIDVSGIKFNSKRHPILEDHQWEKKLGVSNQNPNTEGNKITFDKVKLLSNPIAQEFKQNLDDEFPYQASISIRPTKIEELEDGAVTEVNGYKFKGPGRIIRESIFREASACVFGADHRTGVTALADKTEEEYSVEVLSLSAETEEDETIDIENNTEGGKSMDLEKLKEEHPDLYKEIMDAQKKLEDEKAALSAEVDSLKQEKESLSEEKKKTDERMAKLERAEELRRQKDMQQSADSIIDEKLSAHKIPKRLHSKIRKHIDFNDYVAEDALDTEKFTEFVEAEVKGWADDLKAEFSSKEVSILGLSGDNGGSDDTDDSDALSDMMVQLAGGKTDKE